MRIQEMETDELEGVAEAFFALSSATRLKLLNEITEPLYRQEIADALGITRQGASQHLEVLEEHGFVEVMDGWRESGPVEEFRVVPQRLFALGTTLVELGKLEPSGGPELAKRRDPTQTLGAVPEAPTGPVVDEDTFLLILDGPDAGQRFPIEGDGPRWTIGRGEEQDLVLDHDPYASHHHCEIQVDPNGYAVVDTYSSNGTFVNFGRLDEGGRAPLSAGDVVRVGRTDLVFQQA